MDHEPDLIRRARDGDERAFAELVEHHRPRLEAVAWRMTRDTTTAAEIAQETIVRMHRALPTFRQDASLSTWLYRIVVNLCNDSKRTAARERTIALDDMTDVPADAASPDATAEANERTRVIDDMVQALPEPMREAVVLRYAGGLNYEEIAQTLGVPAGTVASRIHRALRVVGLMLETRGIREDYL